MKGFIKGLLIWIIIFFIVATLYHIFSLNKSQTVKNITFSEFLTSLKEGRISEVTIKNEDIRGKFSNGELFKTFAPYDWELVKILTEKNVKVEVVPKDDGSILKSIATTWLPIILLVLLWFAFVRGVEKSSMRAMSFGRSRTKLFNPEKQKVTFQDVAGLEEAVEEVKEIVEFLKNPEKFKKIGARVPKGILFIGPTGVGKTLLAKAVAGEAGVPFFSAVGSEFVEMFVGVGSSRVRDLFDKVRRQSPCLVFIDEIDAVGRMRGAGIGGGHDEREQTLNQLLVELDGLEGNDGVIVAAATNRPDILDPALLRPGRFDRKVYFPKPDLKGREDILKIHLKKVPSDNIDVSKIAKSCPGFSGADLENLVNESAIIAARAGREKIKMEDIEKARDKIVIGLERRGLVMSEQQKKVIAYHETGHTLVAKFEGEDPVYKVTIMPRGMALGATMQLPQEDKYVMSKDYISRTMTVLLGGRAAEEIVFGQPSTGATDDLEKATELARKIVCEWGMSELGPISLKTREEHIFLGREITRTQELSEETTRRIDSEVEKIIMSAYNRAKTILTEKIKLLHKIAEELFEKETLTIEDINQIIKTVENQKQNNRERLN